MLAVGAVAMVLGGLVYNKAAAIEFWIYEHLMQATASVMALFAACAMVMLYRLRKKEAYYFERAKAVRAVRPKTEMKDYYKGGQ